MNFSPRWISIDCPAASHGSDHQQSKMQKHLRKGRSGRNCRSHALRRLSWQRLLPSKDRSITRYYHDWTNEMLLLTLIFVG